MRKEDKQETTDRTQGGVKLQRDVRVCGNVPSVRHCEEQRRQFDSGVFKCIGLWLVTVEFERQKSNVVVPWYGTSRISPHLSLSLVIVVALSRWPTDAQSPIMHDAEYPTYIPLLMSKIHPI